MNLSLFFLALSIFFSCFFISCSEEKKKVEDITIINAKGAQVISEEELSVQDVEALMKDAEGAAGNYTAILTNDVEKLYYMDVDSGQTLLCKLNTKSNNVSLTLLKEGMKSVKVDSTTYKKIKDFIKISEGDSCSDKTKKATRYKALVKLKRKFVIGDSTAEFTLNMFKK